MQTMMALENWDCDDNDPNLSREPELCDGSTNKYNENIDEDITIPYFIDNDGDGFGDGHPTKNPVNLLMVM